MANLLIDLGLMVQLKQVQFTQKGTCSFAICVEENPLLKFPKLQPQIVYLEHEITYTTLDTNKNK